MMTDDTQDSPHPSDAPAGGSGTPTDRRRLLQRALGVGAATVVVGGLARRYAGPDRLSATGHPFIDSPATAGATAERLGVVPPSVARPAPGRLPFPVDPLARSYVLDNFGDCRGGGSRRHLGVDIMSERGAPIYAVADGLLSGQFTNTGTAGYGWTLRSEEGDDTSYRYFHLDSFAPGLERGDRVRFGDVIGFVGSSGNFIWVDGVQVEDRTNLHLHFEVLRDHRTAEDPLPLIDVPDHIGVGAPLKSCQHLG